MFTISRMLGLTFPGMMDEPGCTAGSFLAALGIHFNLLGPAGHMLRRGSARAFGWEPTRRRRR